LKTRRVCTDADIGAIRLWDVHVDGGKSEMDLQMWLLVGDQPSKGTILKRGTFTDIWSHSGLDGEAGTRLVSGEATAGLLVRRSPQAWNQTCRKADPKLMRFYRRSKHNVHKSQKVNGHLRVAK
jgi:hypothetical protein